MKKTFEYINKLVSKRALLLLLGLTTALLADQVSLVPAPNLPSPVIQRADTPQEQTPFIVGEVVQQTFRSDYLRQSSLGQTITYSGASFIKVHFLSLDLMPGDYVTVSDPTSAEKYTYPGSDSTSDGRPGFWSMSITGDTALVQLHAQLSPRQLSESAISQSGFTIDKYGRGYPQEEIENILAQSTCGTNQRRDVACYQETNPAAFDKSNAVARLLIYDPSGFYSFCTAWRVGVGANMLTNRHCLDSQTKVSASEAWFNYQNQTCAVSSLGSTTKVMGNRLLTSDLVLDFALFTVNNPESIANFGYLDIDARAPVLGEQIYIPQHGDGAPKQFGIESDLNSGNVCRIDAAVLDGLDNGTDTGYVCDTAGGSSGSPVLASSSNKVIALHHFGNSSAPTCTTPNQGVRMDLIWPRIEPYLLQVSPLGSIDDYKPTYIWNEASSATWYYLWVNGPNGNVINQWYQASNVCNMGTCSVSPNVTLSGGVHQWWVQTWNPAGSGPWSSGLSFSTPVLMAPATPVLVLPSGSTSTYTPTYSWNESLVDPANHSAATWYYLWINGPSGNIFKQWYEASAICSNGSCSVVPAGLTLDSGAYTWWIQSWNAAGSSPWSTAMTFNAPVPALPEQAVLVSPIGSIGSNNPTYSWNKASDSTWYYLSVSGSGGYTFAKWYESSAICDASTCSVADATPNLAVGTFTWKVQTWNSGGLGPWSADMTFSTPVPPAQAILNSPNRITADHTPVYIWNEVAGSTWYYLWVNGPSGNVIKQWYTSTEAHCDGSTCWVEPAATLAGGAHTWWIQTWNPAGLGPWSAGMNFTVSS